MAERSIGSGAFDPLSSSGVRTAGLRPGQGPASSRSQRRTETPRPASTAAGHTALAPALHLQPGGSSSSPRNRPNLPIPARTTSSHQSLYDAGVGLLRGVAGG